jgi:anti-anti-sigma factor
MLSYRSHEAAGVLVFTAQQAAPGEAYPPDQDWIYKTIESRVDPRFVVDLGEIPYMTSAEIGFLITLRKLITARQGKLVLIRVDSFILDILRTMKLDRLFLIADDLDDALPRLSGP